jgi:hypothetical protein
MTEIGESMQRREGVDELRLRRLGRESLRRLRGRGVQEARREEKHQDRRISQRTHGRALRLAEKFDAIETDS